MKYTFTPKFNKKNMVQSFALQTLVPIYNITFFDRKESYKFLHYSFWTSFLFSFISEAKEKRNEAKRIVGRVRSDLYGQITQTRLLPTTKQKKGKHRIVYSVLANARTNDYCGCTRTLFFLREERLTRSVIARRQKPADEAIQPILDVRRTGEGETLPGGVIW